MTNRYSLYDCPICGKTLDNSEVVVCPDCGAPYHKECYLKEERCVFPELHQSGEAWKPKKTIADIVDGNASLRCSRCATVNPPDGLFCQVCGNQLNSKAEQAAEQNTGSGSDKPDSDFPFGPIEAFPHMGMPLNPYTTPFGGVAPDEEIDGVPAKDLAIFVGRNSHYYLPKFKEQSQTKARVINWASFFFTGGHFLYRKMYLAGIVVIFLNLMLAVPGAISLYQTLSSAVSAPFATGSLNDGAFNLLFLFDILSIALKFACGLMGNSLYKRHVYKRINTIKEKSQSEGEYMKGLIKQGSVATKLITGLLIGYAALYMLSMVLVILTGV